jgi:hypothetical protein
MRVSNSTMQIWYVLLQRGFDMTEQSNAAASVVSSRERMVGGTSTACSEEVTWVAGENVPEPGLGTGMPWWQRFLVAALGIALVAALIKFGFPRINEGISRISRSEEYVREHATLAGSHETGRSSGS